MSCVLLTGRRYGPIGGCRRSYVRENGSQLLASLGATRALRSAENVRENQRHLSIRACRGSPEKAVVLITLRTDCSTLLGLAGERICREECTARKPFGC